ncbi:HDOD domain-containing protein [Marinobacteraceae bacterium S3BR75-40.1]
MWEWLTRSWRGPGNKAPTPLFEHGKLTSGKHPDELPAIDRDDLAKLDRFLFAWFLDCDDRLLKSPRHSDRPLRRELQRALASPEAALQSLPRQTMVLPQLMKAVADPTINRHALAEIILADPALTDQLLHMANSPYFRPGELTIESVDHAVFVLGIEGVRSLIAAAVMRPMMRARSQAEALFAKRAWHWGLACGRAAELIARSQNRDGTEFFMVGLLPALADLVLFRTILGLHGKRGESRPAPDLTYQLISEHYWRVCALIAEEWDLPPHYHAHLLEAQRPSIVTAHTPLNDGMILATREVLRLAHQRNLPEERLTALLRLSPERFPPIRAQLLEMLRSR